MIRKKAAGKNHQKSARRSRAKRSVTTAKRNWGRLITFTILMLTATAVLIVADNIVFDLVFRAVSHRPSNGDFAGHLIHESINLHHSILENPNNKERLLKNIADPVKWYGPRAQSHGVLRFGSEYDRFYFMNELQFDRQEFQENNYEVRFDGMYRYRHPDKALVAFESATAVIERGKITELRPYQNPNQYRHKWINALYRWYPAAALIGGFLGTIILINISRLPEEIWQWLWRRLQRVFSVI